MYMSNSVNMKYKSFVQIDSSKCSITELADLTVWLEICSHLGTLGQGISSAEEKAVLLRFEALLTFFLLSW